MILGIGTDLVSQRRIRDSWQRFGERFVQRILTDDERARFLASQCPERVLAKCFAAKEAVSKALGTGIAQGISWQHIELCRGAVGQPLIRLSAAALDLMQVRGGREVLISLSDEDDYVLAFAVLAS